jgi:hypothetical protein
MRYTEASSLARMFCFSKRRTCAWRRCSDPKQPADRQLVSQAQAAALLSVSGPSQRSAAAAQAPGKPDLARAVEQAAVPVLLADSLARDDPLV